MAGSITSTAQGPETTRSEKIIEISKGCIQCQACRKECAFLIKYGTPGEIAERYDPVDPLCRAMAFECSLCRLCSAVCPVQLNPAEMFLEMRRQKVRRNAQSFSEHQGLLSYEKKGNSRFFSYYGLPAGCEAIFFAGCTLPGTRPKQTLQLYNAMKQWIPRLGIVLDCCNKISHDLGREAHFQAMFGELRGYLVGRGVKKVIVACPSCYRIFDQYGKGLSVTTAYEVLADHMTPADGLLPQTAVLHDPCSIRFNEEVQAAVRRMISHRGLKVEELPHSGRKTLCCGEGGSVACLSPELAEQWGKKIKEEAKGKRVLTYCAGCANHLSGWISTSHIVDFLFEPEAALAGQIRVSKAPMTYLNRFILKRRFKKEVKASVTRERTFRAEKGRKEPFLKRLLVFGLLIAAIFLVRYAGATKYLEQDALRNLIQGYGVLAPAIYMLIYTLAPVLLLPGLPITIVGGILFGPFWGVVYTITSATAGACLAFLVARYVARDWVLSKLRSPRWRRLDSEVEKHGWKMVAFTRLIPAFPFNLLNYAFGLTKIRFSHYAITTFLCMLPACIAFIVFSSSLLDLIAGKISPGLIIGAVLIALVSLFPLVYKKIKKSNEN